MTTRDDVPPPEVAPAEEAFYRAIVENAMDAVLVLDQGCRVRYLSPSMAGILGREREEVRGFDFCGLVHRDDRERCRAALREALEVPGRPVRATLRIRRGDGSTRDLEVVGRNLLGDPAVQGIALDIRDFTELGRHSRELESLNRDLKAFAQTLAHDLKSPLNNAYACALTIEGRAADALDGMSRRGIRMIRDSLESMNATIDGMLACAGMGGAPGMTCPVDLERLVEDVLEELRSSGRMQGVECAVRPGLPVVRCDPVRLRQALSNLLSNAVKFTAGRAAPRIEVGVEETAEGRAAYVRDNGPGIRPEDLECIFRPLVRAAGSEEVPGHGLGLAIVRRAVESWDGRTWAESDFGRGSAFYFTLPEVA